MQKCIDIHNHWLSKEYIRLIESREICGCAEIVSENDQAQIHFINPRGRVVFPLKEEFTVEAIRREQFNERGMEKVVVSHVPFTFHYAHDASRIKQLHETINDDLASLVLKDRERCRGLGNVPLQDVNMAIEELTRAVQKLGLSGVQVGTNVCGRYLGDREFIPFFEAAESLQAFVLIHPLDVAGGGDVLKQHYFRNLIGNPLDTTICAGSLIFGGIMDRFPGLRIGLSHGGGNLPYLIGRWDRGFEVRDECSHLPRYPSEYLRDFYYDHITHSVPAMEYLVSLVGADRVMAGTDYPFDMGVDRPMDLLSETALDEEEKVKILRDNADAIFFKGL